MSYKSAFLKASRSSLHSSLAVTLYIVDFFDSFEITISH